jgi:hypothetical protein
MPAASTYPSAHVQACRADFAAQVAAYRDLIAAASKASGASLVRVDAALAAFEPGYFNTLLVALDARFVHRARDAEDSVGNPLAEVRLLAASLMAHGGVMTVDRAVPYEPSRAVLRIEAGDRIALNADDFEAIASAFLDEVERRFP